VGLTNQRRRCRSLTFATTPFFPAEQLHPKVLGLLMAFTAPTARCCRGPARKLTVMAAKVAATAAKVAAAVPVAWALNWWPGQRA